MGRSQARNVDCFPCSYQDDKALAILESRWGNDGYAFFHRLQKCLGRADYHYLDLRKADNWEQFLVEMRVSEAVTREILDKLATIGIIDKELWSQRIIWSDSFVERVKYIWRKRKADLPQRPLLIQKSELSERNESNRSFISAPEMPMKNKVQEDSRSTPEETKAPVKAAAPPQAEKVQCLGCGRLVVEQLIKGNQCVYCTLQTIIECPGCERNVGKDMIGEDGKCIHCREE